MLCDRREAAAQTVPSNVRQTVASPGVARASALPSPSLSAAPTGIAPALLTEEQGAAVWAVPPKRFRELCSELGVRTIALGPRTLRWSRAELEAAIERMPRQDQPESEPYQLLRGRIARLRRGEAAA